MIMMDELKISEMKDGEKYPMTQGGHGYSDGVWAEREGDNIKIRHFWVEDILKFNGSKDYYFFDEEDGVCYPKKLEEDIINCIHKDVMQMIPDAITYDFEDMTLSEFYDVVILGLFDLQDEKNHIVPKHLDGKQKHYNRNGKLLFID